VAPVCSNAFERSVRIEQSWMTLLNSTGGTRATISAQVCMDAGSDGTRIQPQTIRYFIVLADGTAVLLLILSGDFGRSPVYGHHGARLLAHNDVWARRRLSAMAIGELIASSQIYLF
jgi:hypothetical protein